MTWTLACIAYNVRLPRRTAIWLSKGLLRAEQITPHPLARTIHCVAMQPLIGIGTQPDGYPGQQKAIPSPPCMEPHVPAFARIAAATER